MPEIIELNKSGLNNYIRSVAFVKAPVVAISIHRGISHIHNPKVKDDDILLLLAMEGEQLIGYLGVLPDDIYFADNQKIHCGWMSCLWIDPNQRGKKIAQKLITACFSAWDGNILLTEFTKAAGNLYDRMGIFAPSISIEGKRWYIQSDLHRLLPEKNKRFNQVQLILKLTDFCINTITNFVNWLSITKQSPYHFEEINQILPETAAFLNKIEFSGSFRREADCLNWIISYPWIKEGNPSDPQYSSYYFTSAEKQFVCKGLKVYNKNKVLCAFIIFTVRNHHLRLPYIFHFDNNSALLFAIRYLIKQYGVKTFTTYQEPIIQYLKSHMLVFSTQKKVVRKYLVSSKLERYLGNDKLLIQDGDGDCAFT